MNKITLDIDLKDIWPDYGFGDSLADTIEQNIARSVRDAIYKKIQAQVENEVGLRIRDYIQKTLREKIDEYVGDYVSRGVVPNPRYIGRETQISVWVDEQLSQNHVFQRLAERVDEIAIAFASQYEKKYDAMFTTLVENLKNGEQK